MDIQQFIRNNIKELSAYSSARDEFADAAADMIFIDANENPFNSGLNRYPDPQQQLVKKEWGPRRSPIEHPVKDRYILILSSEGQESPAAADRK